MAREGFFARFLRPCVVAAWALIAASCGGGHSPDLVSLAILGAPEAALRVGQSLQLNARGTYSDSSVQDVTAQATWVSTNPAVLAVTPAGLVTAITAGRADVIATVAGVTTFAQLEAALPPPPRLALLADGVGDQARFSYPNDVAADGAGNVYVADTGNHTIRKITPAGEVTTLAGVAGQSGNVDGTGTQARFSHPMGIATDGAGHVYVADSDNSAIRKITPAGEVSTFAAVISVFVRSVAVDRSGTVYVAGRDYNTDRGGVQKITPAGEVTLLPAFGTNPVGVATDPAGNVYVANTAPTSTIDKLTPGGQISTLASFAGTGLFWWPSDVAADGAGNVYVADMTSHDIRKIAASGEVTTLAGGRYGTADGNGAAANFFYPNGVATDRVGNVYVADTYNHTIRKITPAGDVSTLAGIRYGSTDGVGTQALFGVQCTYKVWPGGLFNVTRYCSSFRDGVAADAAGNVYVADYYNQTIRKITPAGQVSTLAGLTGQAGSDDGVGAQVRFAGPSAIAADRAGDLYVIDSNGIRKVTPSGAVSTLIRGYGGYDLAADDAGNLYISDTDQHVIRKLTPAGEVTTFAGVPGTNGSADGLGSEARFSRPWGISTDSAGNVFVADSGNSTIRKITPNGEVSTLAGVPGDSGSADGTGAQARFSSLGELAVDSRGNVYVADTTNQTIRKVTPTGEVSTLVGVAGRRGFTAGALPGLLTEPVGVAVSGTSLYITMVNGVAVVTDLP